jgi:tight adherence protein C
MMVALLSVINLPMIAAVLTSLACLMLWQGTMALVRRPATTRLDVYLDRGLDETGQQNETFRERVLVPMAHRVLAFLGRLMPKRNYARVERMLVYADHPGNITVLDYQGLRLFLLLTLSAGVYFATVASNGPSVAVRYALVAGAIGFQLPWYWLRSKAKKRQKAILRALPDALDMLTIGVEAGLAFESALLRVGEQWDNPLTLELRRVVREMRMGTSRNDALRRLVDRTGVEDLSTFVAVLIQSSQLGVSIAHVLHSQAAQMREVRRQRAEELARQASVKIVVVLVFFIFPSLFIVILGPAVPQIMETLTMMAGS